MGRPTDINSGLSHADVVRLLDYDPLTGKFRWRVKRNQAGGEAGWVNPETGYRIITVCGVHVMAHRLAWFWMKGEWPQDRIDHRNMDRGDQSFANLRPASDSQNRANSRAKRDNMLGIKGVRLHESGRYQARVWNGERNIHLGLFDDWQEAKAVYDAAAVKMFGEFARSA